MMLQSSRALFQCRSTRTQNSHAALRMMRLPLGRRTASLVVKATLEPINDAIPMAPSVIPNRPVALPSYRVSMFDALKFNGPAPEVINSRLAMMGLIAVAIRESETGLTAMQQLTSPEVGMPLLAVLFVYASLVPILAGAKMEPFGFFTPKAEITNGRAAMLGWAALLMLEYKAGVPFF